MLSSPTGGTTTATVMTATAATGTSTGITATTGTATTSATRAADITQRAVPPAVVRAGPLAVEPGVASDDDRRPGTGRRRVTRKAAARADAHRGGGNCAVGGPAPNLHTFLARHPSFSGANDDGLAARS